MNDLLFYAAVVLLAISVISCIVYNVVYWTNNLRLFESLLFDEKYPFEVPEDNYERFAKAAAIKDFCGRCWAKTAFRHKTEGEKKLDNLITGNGLFGGLALFLYFVPAVWGVFVGFILAVLLQYVYRNIIFAVGHIVAWRTARRIYWQYQKGEL